MGTCDADCHIDGVRIGGGSHTLTVKVSVQMRT